MPRARVSRSLIAAAALLTFSTSLSVHAAPTEQLRGGATIVRLSDEFLGAAQALGLRLEAEQSARLFGRYAVFPIPAGALDLESLAGDILHSGGLSITAGPTRVDLLSFIIDTNTLALGATAEDRAVLTGVVTASGDVVGRVPLFDLTLNRAPDVSRGGHVRVSHVDLRLSAEAAEALNALFQVNAFTEGLSIGRATVKTRVLRDRRWH